MSKNDYRDWKLADQQWSEVHLSEVYINKKQTQIERLKTIFNKDNYPKRMLDIGCGYAYESEFFHKEFGTEIWLLDSDISKDERSQKNIKLSGQSAQIKAHKSASSFAFYHTLEELKKSWEERGMKYNFVDVKNIDIPEEIKFDLIYSSKSCGFHYPMSEYKHLILKHSHPNTSLIFDVRKSNFDQMTKGFSAQKVLFDDHEKPHKSHYVEFKPSFLTLNELEN